MGWSFGWNTKRELVQYLTKPWGEVEKHIILDHTCAGNVLWMVMEETTIETGKAERFILCCPMQCNGDGWGYKGMEESWGPYYYSCPLRYLEMVPEVKNAEWREKVKAYWQGKQEARAKNNALTAGTRITLPEGWTVRNFTLAERRKQTWMAYGSDGRLYRLPLKAIQAATITTA